MQEYATGDVDKSDAMHLYKCTTQQKAFS